MTQPDTNTIAQTFSGLPIRMATEQEISDAKQFGERVEAQDRDVIIIAYRWNDNLYIMDIHHGI